MPPLKQKWSQKDLRNYLLQNGWTADEIPAGELPQAIKNLTFLPEPKR